MSGRRVSVADFERTKERARDLPEADRVAVLQRAMIGAVLVEIRDLLAGAPAEGGS